MPAARILVVDDDLPIRELLVDVLESEGYLVCQAANGRQALGVVAENQPHVIILDLMMPVMDGGAFTREYHSRSLGRPAPILLTSAAPSLPEGADQLGTLGVCGYIAKPFDVSKLLDTVAALVEPQRADPPHASFAEARARPG